MANEQQLHRRTQETRSSAYDEEEELELQLEVKSMAESILHYRTTLPDRLNKTFGSLITNDGDQNPGDTTDQLKLLSEVALPEEEDQETAEKIKLLKLKISSNISAIPIILERMKEAISRINQLELQIGSSIHPAFKKEKQIERCEKPKTSF